MDFTCPSCSAKIELLTRTALLVKCSYCSGQLIRTEAGFDLFGQAALIPPDISPVQIGTSGRSNDLSFVIVGRSRIKWGDGAWNEWQLQFSDATYGWLAEAQGSWAISGLEQEFSQAECDNNQRCGEFRQAYYNKAALIINDIMFVQSDYKDASYDAFEGELSFVPKFGERVSYADFLSTTGDFASIEKSGDRFKVFSGRYCEFDELHFSNLRELPGWKYTKLQKTL